MLPTWLSFPLLFPYRVNVGSLGSLIPYSVNGPFKRTLMALFRLAWSNKLQLPIFITVCFMAFDIRLQLEINIFWEANNQNGRNRVPGNGNPPIIVPVLEIQANEGDANSSDDSDNDDDDDDDTDSDETELHSLKDNNDSDDMEEDEDDDNERTKRNSRYFSEQQDPDQNNSSDDRNLNDSGGNNDNGSGNFQSSSTNSSNSNAGVSRTNIILPSDSNTDHAILSEELNKFFRSYCTTNSGTNINIFSSLKKNNERRQSQTMIQPIDFNNTSESSIRNMMSSSCPSPSAFSNWKCLPKNYYAMNITNT